MSNHIIQGRFVVCAATRYGSADQHAENKSLVICSPRHYDATHHRVLDYLPEWLLYSEMEQGFVDQFGVFMDRSEALKVAKEAGQLNTRRTKTAPEDQLFSEDLY